jgi:membrane protease YdiL (CAAX protease family)
MGKILSKLFRWQPSRDTLYAVITGIIIIALSIAMGMIENLTWLEIVIRDIGQIVAGILFPLLFIHYKRDRFADYGFSVKKWYIFLPINLILGILLLMFFLSDVPPPEGFPITPVVLWTCAYIMLAVIFEMVFFYGFLRTLFERAFGIVPGIILCAAFYSLHHAGFQPEFGKLFIVGLLFASLYRTGNNILLVFPFLAWVGAVYDVLIQSTVVKPVLYPGIRTLYLAALIPGTIILIWIKSCKRKNNLKKYNR